MKLYDVKFYKNSQSRDVIREFIDKQEKRTASRITHLIKALELQGPYLRMPYSKKIQFNLFELRATGSVCVSIIYTGYKEKFYILHLFIKKTQKIPQKEIKIALARLKEII